MGTQWAGEAAQGSATFLFNPLVGYYTCTWRICLHKTQVPEWCTGFQCWFTKQHIADCCRVCLMCFGCVCMRACVLVFV